MRKGWLLGLTIFSLGMPLVFKFSSSPGSIPTTPTIAPSPPKNIHYEQRILPHSIVHILRVPSNSKFLVTPAVSPKVTTIEEFAQKHRAQAILNAGFFDPVNQKSTSYVVISGQLVADPKENERLVNNPKLKPYLSKILNRTEFRRYICGETVRYDISLHSEPSPAGCELADAIGGGPRLLPELGSVQEGFVDHTHRRDAIGGNQPNARSAIGITRDCTECSAKGDRSIVLVMVAQKSSDPVNSGMTLAELADVMKTLGVEKAVNLDGGSSSSLYYKDQTFYGKVNLQGNSIKRPVKSVLLVKEN